MDRTGRIEDRKDDGKGSDDSERLRRARGGIEASPIGGPTAHHRTYRGSALDDLSENAEYHAAEEEQSHNEGRIAELEDKLARADIIDISKLSGDTVKFGATVTLIDEDTDKKAVWQLVGEVEADAKKGRIHHFASGACADRQEKGRDRRGDGARGAKAYEITKVEWR